jgi:hypothetical protein
MGRLRALALAAALAATCAAAVPDASARVVGCHTHADFNLLITSVRNLSCRDAAREMRRYRGSISRTFRTPHHFTCRRVSGNRLGGQWRCVRRSKAFRFEFGD